MRISLRVRQVGNLINLSTPLGRATARLGGAALAPGPRGLLIATGYRLAFPFALAFTVGNVVLTRETSLADDLLRHEERHSWQWFWCAGLPFLPAYAIAMGWSVIRTGDRSSANLFERLAGLTAGGYIERPRRPVSVGVRAVMSDLRGRA